MQYKALLITEQDGQYLRSIQNLDTENLSQNDVLIRVHYSSLNYKDALSAIGNKGVTKSFPHTPGIDAAGVVVESLSPEFQPGDQVIISGYDLGMNTPGGFGAYIRVPADWIVPLPGGISLKESMIIGTAGFTAGISVTRLVELVKPEAGKVVVTGATGGVGSVAVSLLSKLGYEVVAVSGKMSEVDFLYNLGANDVVNRDQFGISDKKPILSSLYAGGIDTVGGVFLENLIKKVHPLGAVTTCGSVGGTGLSLSVFPFILRGISLIGVSAQNYPMDLRVKLWSKLASDWKPDNLTGIFTEITLEELPRAIEAILKGELKGRTIVNLID